MHLCRLVEGTRPLKLSALSALLLIVPFATSTGPAQAQGGVVSSAHPLATEAGIAILKAGGNAFDAAIATSLVLGVVEPQSSGIGGGGFALVYAARTAEARVLDFREVAPLGATAAMYRDKDGKVIPRLSLDGYLAVAVPGQAAGLAQLQATYASLPLRTLAEPAIRLARTGFAVTPLVSERLKASAERLARDPETARIFLPNGKAPAVGTLLQQPDLARTLTLWAESAGQSFYRGETARSVASAMSQQKGLVTTVDFERYSPVWRDPLVGSYRGVPVITMPPPGSGPVLLTMLNTLENFDLASQSPLLRAHLSIQAMSRAYADRSRFLADPAFVPVPVSTLTAKSYGQALAKTITRERATPSGAIVPGSLLPLEVLERFNRWEAPRQAENTSHLSVMDESGNTVAITQTINGAFGAAVVAPGTGILLNNEMDDFSSAPGNPNLFGLVGEQANAIAPAKRPLSSMSPTILMRSGRPWITLGSPGGAFITTAVLQTIVNIVDYKLPLQQAVDAPRYHHQWQPDRLLIEKNEALSAEALGALGYRVSPIGAMGNVQAAEFRPGSSPTFIGASDSRREGTSAVWNSTTKAVPALPASARPATPVAVPTR